MVFKPVGADENGKFPTRVETALSAKIASSPAVTDKAKSTDVAAVYNKKARAQYGIRRQYPGRVSRVALPTTGGVAGTGFGWQDAPVRIFKSGKKYTTDFDVAKFKGANASTIYVDPVNGNNANDGLTTTTARKTLNSGVTAVTAGGTVILMGKGVVYRGEAFNGSKITKSCNIVAQYPGEITCTMSDNLAWTAAVGATFTAPRSNVAAVIDRGVPGGFRYTQAASRAECEATPGSWFQDGANLIMHTLDGTIPDNTRHLALLMVQGWWVEPSAASVSVYVEGINLIGGHVGGNITANGITGYTCDLYMKNCEVSYATDSAWNSLTAQGARYCFLQKVTAHNSRKDGLNYTPINGAGTRVDNTRFIEVDCHSYAHGIFSPANAQNNNATTAHTAAKGIRIGGTYHETTGGIIADVQADTQSVNYSCIAFDPLSGTTDLYGAVFVAQQAGADMWAYGCTFFGGTGWDVVALNGTTVTLDETSFDTRTGASYTTVTNEV